MKYLFSLIEFNEFRPIIKSSSLNLFNSYNWLFTLYKTYQFPTIILHERINNIYIPFCIIKNNFEATINCLPFSDYVLEGVNEEFIEQSIIYLNKNYPDFQISIKAIMNNLVDLCPASIPLIRTPIGITYQIHLKQQRNHISKNAPYYRNIRKAVQNGISVGSSTSIKSLRDFYNLHLNLRVQKFKKIPQPYSFFQNLHDIFIRQNKGFIYEAKLDNIVIAAWIILIEDNKLYYKYAASTAEQLIYRPNDLLYKSLVEYGTSHSFDLLDLGLSGIGPAYDGLLRFKKKEMGSESRIYKYSFTPTAYHNKIYRSKAEFINKRIETSVSNHDTDSVQTLSNKLYHLFS
ncbi:MAG: GNAT family N-acetyltransferase [Bacteroidales bacterium]|nr:GNAT family N-acetyltransferase [Bacteroidales bacterium]